jgi:hypothetical protein
LSPFEPSSDCLSRWEGVDEPLGTAIAARRRSAGVGGSSATRIKADNAALGMWISELRLMLINDAHPAVAAAGKSTREVLLTWVAWHEWGHALSLTRRNSRAIPCHARRAADECRDRAALAGRR